MREIFKKVLVSLDKSKASEKVVSYVACLASLFEVEKIVLLHVIKLSYLARHAEHVTVELEKVEESEAFKRIKERYYKQNIEPMLNKAKQEIISMGVPEDKVEIKIREGLPEEEIVEEAKLGYTALVIKRGADLSRNIKIAEVTNSVIHNLQEIAIFVVGEEKVDVKACPMPRILVPVDGSPHSLKAARCAVSLLKAFKTRILKITLLYVGVGGEKILKKAREIFGGNVVEEKIREGSPGEEIVKEAREGGYSTVIMGRRGLSKLQEFFVGSVTKYVLENLVESTVVVV